MEKKLHFILTTPKLIYPYSIAIQSAIATQKIDRFILWHTCDIEETIGDVEYRKIAAPEFPALRDVDAMFRAAHTKDFLQWKILYEEGGFYADLDTLFLKNIGDMLEGYQEVVAALDVENITDWKHPFHIGVVGAKPQSAIIKLIWERSKEILQQSMIKWGATGPAIFSEIVLENIEKVRISSWGELGGHKYRRGQEIYSEFDAVYRDDTEILDKTRVLHLYGQHKVEVFQAVNESYIAQSQSLYARLCREIISGQGQQRQEPKPKPKSRQKPKDKWRFHLLGPAHLPTNKEEAIACAYSGKTLRMAKMLKMLGHDVIFYGVEGSIVECDEFVQVSTKEILRETYGDYDYKNMQYKHNPLDLAHRHFNANAAVEIAKRKEFDDFLLISMGNYQKPIADNTGLRLTVEMGIGYTGVFAEFKVFESYTWMAHVYGLMNQSKNFYYDVVIPNYFDPADFEYNSVKDDYLLYLGRIINWKGIDIAKETAKVVGKLLIVAGQKSEEKVDLTGVKFVGFADLEKRRQLLSKAKALFVPTKYIEPFGGVSIEAAFSGTPVIATDWGCFSENVLEGITGYRCRTLDDFVQAAKNIDKIDPAHCYQWAMNNFSMDRVKDMYQHYFQSLQDVMHSNGWYHIRPEAKDPDWLWREYPHKPGGNHAWNGKGQSGSISVEDIADEKIISISNFEKETPAYLKKTRVGTEELYEELYAANDRAERKAQCLPAHGNRLAK